MIKLILLAVFLAISEPLRITLFILDLTEETGTETTENQDANPVPPLLNKLLKDQNVTLGYILS